MSAPSKTATRPAVPIERVAVYCRISLDPRKKEEGVERQREDGLALAQARGWQVHEVYIDNDISALNGAPRPAYERMMAAVAAGHVTRIVAYGLARLWRNRRERADGITFLSAHRVSVTLVKGSDLDLTSAFGRTVAGLMGEVDTMESEIKGERVARAALARAEQGKASGHVAYGWLREYERSETGVVLSWRDVEHPEHAAVVRRITDELLANRALRRVADGLNKDGVAPPRKALRAANGRAHEPAHRVAERWQPGTVRKVALRWANVGIVERNRRPFGPATWPAIVDRAKFDQVMAMLTAPRRSSHSEGVRRPGARKYLLTYGIGRCGVCGGKLRHKVVRQNVATQADQVIYLCLDGRCVGRNMKRVDELVGEAVVERLSRSDAADLLTRDDTAAREASERAAQARARLARLQDDYDDDVIDRDMYVRGTRRWRAVLAEAEAEALRCVQGVDAELVRRLCAEAEAAWDELDAEQKVALLEAMGCTVVINKVTKRGPGWDPSLVKVRFADDEETV